jgi:hypothetical protein
MPDNERDLSQKLFGGQAQQSMGAMEAVKEGLKEFRDAMYPGLTWDKITSDLGQEFKQQLAHGAHELAAALFSGNGTAFVMYPRTGAKEDQPSHEQAQDSQGMQQDSPGQHLERGGRSL